MPRLRPPRALVVLAVLCGVWLGGPGVPWGVPSAQADRLPTPRLVEQAQRQVQAGDFEQALVTLQDALGSPDNSNLELAEVYWRMGEVYVFLKREKAALDTFERLLYLAPDWEAPRLTSPRVRQSFEQARRSFTESRKQVALSLPPQQVPQAGQPITLEAQVSGLRPDWTARVYYRRALSEAWMWTALAPAEPGAHAGAFVARLPAFPPGTSVEYYVEIQGPDRRRIQGEGSSLAPRSLSVPKTSAAAIAPAPPAVPSAPAVERAWYREPWVWGVVAGAVVAGAVGTYVALAPDTATVHLKVTVTP